VSNETVRRCTFRRTE